MTLIRQRRNEAEKYSNKFGHLVMQHSRDITEMKAEQRLIRQAVIGNGSSEQSLVTRVSLLEMRLGQSPTWQWVIEKALLPLVMMGAGVVIGIALGTP